jgi:hypothetical protein
MAKCAQKLSESYKTLYNLYKTRKSTPDTRIFIINSDELNIQQGPVTIERAGRDNDYLLYMYYTPKILSPNSIRVIKGIDLN